MSSELSLSPATALRLDPRPSAGSQRSSGRIVPVDRSELRPLQPVTAPDLRGFLERAIVTASDTWILTETERRDAGDAYAQLSRLGAAVLEVMNGGTPDFSRWPLGTAINEPIGRLRRGILEQGAPSNRGARAEDVLSMLSALERVQALSEKDVGHRFTSQLLSNRALDLVVGIAHDMRSPLSSIVFLVDVLRNAQRGTISAAQERQLGLVYGAAHGLSQLVSDVIELARGCDRLLDRHPIPFSVSEIVNGVLDVVKPIAEEKRLVLHVQMPEVDARMGYPAALSRVLLNLTTNALKFTSEGYVEVTCKQTSRSAIEFSVRDTGPGIAPDKVATLYDAFRPRERTNGFVLSSSGLGLSICQRLVTAMGGELRLDTVPGAYARFHFVVDLPAAAKI
jgi:signal transduction histidine kinase